MRKKYRIEHEAERILVKIGKLIDELILAVRKIAYFGTHIPKNKMDKVFWLIATIVYAFFTYGVFFGRR